MKSEIKDKIKNVLVGGLVVLPLLGLDVYLSYLMSCRVYEFGTRLLYTLLLSIALPVAVLFTCGLLLLFVEALNFVGKYMRERKGYGNDKQ